MTIQIEEGKWYARADGSVKGPMRFSKNLYETGFDWSEKNSFRAPTWRIDGRASALAPSHYDLVREVPAPAAAEPEWAAKVEAEAAEEMDSLDRIEAELKADIAKEEAADIKTHIADEAKRIVSGARRSAYGTPEQNFERIARFWQAYFESTGRADIKITAADVSPMMRLMKEARLCESPQHLDSFIDLIGYAMTGAEVNKVRPPSA